ncbi:ABC transporter permease [Flexivirga sp. ID2601S]|uniref:ABC transporter permease n=1 Tax=Flexivirga aerilata TaxID=1656889 RepID=A0A849ACL3_9MICO|nr:ABC transporter permease [Flexivirga aerilata]NNG38265.1 ABC transporter permease [Flexivirga aerilata]
MRRLLLRWLLTSIPLVLAVSMLTFALTAFVPGDAARSILGPNATPELVAQLRAQLGLDQPLWKQYWNWLTGAVHGDFGTSIASGSSVASDLGSRLPVTLSLMIGAVLVAGLVGVGLGVLGALRGGWLGKVVDIVSLVGAAVPSFWFGLILVTLFAVQFKVFPATGYVSFGDDPRMWLSSLVLPVLTLGLTSSAPVAKQTRDGVRGELERDYVMMLRARGTSERSIIFRHVLRNAAAPVVTVLGLVLIAMLSGTVLAETVFVMPGLGGLAVSATQAHDIPEIQGVAVVFSIIVVIVNLIVELLYAALNPRVRT